MAELAHITRLADCGMITLRGDLATKPVTRAVKAATGQAMPASGQMFGTVAGGGVAWMSPDEALLMVPYADVATTIAGLDKALAGMHYLAVDVSDARAVFDVTGADAAEVLARLCPVDLHKDRFGLGQFRRTRLAQIAAAFWRHDAGFTVVCFRSVADYAQDLLVQTAKAPKTGALG